MGLLGGWKPGDAACSSCSFQNGIGGALKLLLQAQKSMLLSFQLAPHCTQRGQSLHQAAIVGSWCTLFKYVPLPDRAAAWCDQPRGQMADAVACSALTGLSMGIVEMSYAH